MSRIVIVGAGPAGLACAARIACTDGPDRVRVIDPSAAWLSAWRRRFAQQAITTLRSPAVHHPHPDPFALLGTSDRGGLVRRGGTHLPTTARFETFIDELVDRMGLTDRVVGLSAVAVTIDPDGRPAVRLSDGTTERPDHLVLATNTRQPVMPRPMRDIAHDPRIVAADDADVRTTPIGARIAIIGGGLSAAHLAIGAARRGAHVTLVARRRLSVRRFDVHPSWLGPRKLHPFAAEPDPDRRRRAIDTARGGGSVPHDIRRSIDDCVAAGRLELCERNGVVGVHDDAPNLRLGLDDGSHLEVDLVWLATGGRTDVTADPLCAGLVRASGAAVADGLPDLGPGLEIPGTRIHLTGFATALRLGPTAGNLIGHRRAAARIAAAIHGEDPDRADRITTGDGACPRTPAW